MANAAKSISLVKFGAGLRVRPFFLVAPITLARRLAEISLMTVELAARWVRRCFEHAERLIELARGSKGQNDAGPSMTNLNPAQAEVRGHRP